MGWLNGYVAAITGANSGIGRAVAQRYLEEGAAGVVVLDRNVEGVAALALTYPGRIFAIEGDVRDHCVHEEMIRVGIERFGQLDVLVANAGIFDFHRPFSRYSAETLAAALDDLVAVNVRGYLFAALAARESLIKSRGSMIFTASVAGVYAGGGGVLYTATKHAVVGAVRQLSLELAPDVRVNGVGPGGTLTDLRGSASLGHARRSLADKADVAAGRIAAAVPLGFAQQPEDHAGLYVLLADRRNSRAITGQVFMSDGGAGMRML